MRYRKSQFERAMRKYGIKKKLRAADWRLVGVTIAQRSRDGKQSDVFVHGQRVPKEKVRREVQRYNFEAQYERHQRRQ